MKTKFLRKGILVLAVMLVMCFVPAAAFAEMVPDLKQDTGSLNIHLIYHDEAVDTPVDGAVFTVYKVAGMKVKSGSCTFDLEEAFASTKINFDGMTASASAAAAKTCSDLVKDKRLKGTSKTTNGKGDAVFSDLPVGMYLVMQTGAKGSAEKYSYVTPYLVMVPLFNEEADEWLYDVDSEPKEMLTQPPTNELPPDEETPPNPPADSDPSVDGEGGSGGDDIHSGGGTSDTPDNYSGGSGESEEENDTPEPDEPEKTTTTTTTTHKTLIDTSDPTQMGLLIGVIVLAGACLGILVTRKKKNGDE